MNRRDFIKVAGALGVCLVTPRIASNPKSVIDGQSGEIVEDYPHTVKVTIHGLMQDTHIWIGTVDDQGIGHETLWQGRSKDEVVSAHLPVEYDNQQVIMRTIHMDAIYNQMQFTADKDQEVHVNIATRVVLQVQERNYAPA